MTIAKRRKVYLNQVNKLHNFYLAKLKSIQNKYVRYAAKYKVGNILTDINDKKIKVTDIVPYTKLENALNIPVIAYKGLTIHKNNTTSKKSVVKYIFEHNVKECIIVKQTQKVENPFKEMSQFSSC